MSVEYNDGYGNDMSQIKLSDQEKVLNKLAEAWNLFQSINKKEKHICDPDEFCKAIHAAQNIMFAEIVLNGDFAAMDRLKRK